MSTPPLRSESPEIPSDAKATSENVSNRNVFENTSENASTSGDTATVPDSIAVNPFDNENSRILFDAIDQLQSCGVSQDIQIPQLVIVGEQSTGKSSLLQSLTDIPFPVGAGCCTRFATRIVSKRTAPETKNAFKITIVEPEVTISDFNYPANDSYKEYVRVGENLSAEEFKAIMDEVTTSYMGIKEGRGTDRKNFATEVLRVELSGPLRSHFSIVDIPGIFRNSHGVNVSEMNGIRKMVLQYMKTEGNIVICVADAITDYSNQELPALAAEHVDKKRLVGVFTKCDIAASPEGVVSIATSGHEQAQSMNDGWFVVRNRSDKEDKSFDVSQAEERLFAKAPWNAINDDRRGSAMLRKYLSSLLCARMRDTFPQIQDSIKQRLASVQASQQALGNPRPTHHERQQYLRDVVQQFENAASMAVERPWLLPEALRVRGKVKTENEKFSKLMHDDGHKYHFESPDVEPEEELARITAVRTKSDGSPIFNFVAPTQPFGMTPTKGIKVPATPPSSAPSLNVSPEKQPQPHPQHQKENISGPFGSKAGPKADIALFQEIRTEIHISQSTLLPGLINPAIMPVLFQKQTEKWQEYAEQHLTNIANGVADAAVAILERVYPKTAESRQLFEELFAVLGSFWDAATKRTLEELKTFCHRERFGLLGTTDPRFQSRLKAWQTIRLLESMESLPSDHPHAHAATIFDRLHASIEDNMVKAVHDILKVYYQISLESFIRHITHNIVEDFVSNPNGPLKALCKDWVYSLDEAKLEKLAREDENTLAKRERYTAAIRRLETAHEIATRARERTSHVVA